MGGGGERRIRTQHEKGKGTARERLEQFLDEGSFVELGTFVQTGLSDASSLEIKIPEKGSYRLRPSTAAKFCICPGFYGSRRFSRRGPCRQDLPYPGLGLQEWRSGDRVKRFRGPVYRRVYALDGYGSIFSRNTIYSGVIPQISVIMGPCAGGAVYSALQDFIFMVSGPATCLLPGPKL